VQSTPLAASEIVPFLKADFGWTVVAIYWGGAADAQHVGLLIIFFSYVILGLLTIGTPDRGPFDMADSITNTASLFSCEEHHGDNV